MGIGVSLSMCSTGTRKQALVSQQCHQRPTFLRRSDRGDTSHFFVQNLTCFKDEENDFNVNFWNLSKVLGLCGNFSLISILFLTWHVNDAAEFFFLFFILKKKQVAQFRWKQFSLGWGRRGLRRDERGEEGGELRTWRFQFRQNF